MSWELATIIGSLGVSFFMLFLYNSLSDKHESFKLGLMILSWTNLLYTLWHIQEILTFDVPLATDIISLAESEFIIFVVITIAFLFYWLSILAWSWTIKLLMKRKN